MSRSLPDGPLTGLRVLDLSRVLAGPYCSQALADMGADVIKVEHPRGGDDTRRFGPPFVEGESTYFLSINRGKRSLALDFKRPEGREVLLRLLDQADVLLENFRPGALERQGLDPPPPGPQPAPRLLLRQRLRARRPARLQPPARLRPHGPGSRGHPSLTGPPDAGPSKVGASIADVVSGMYATQGILLALIARQTTGRGQHVDVAMLDGQVSLLTYLASAWLNAGELPGRLGNRHLSVAPYSTFAAADGWLNLAVANDALWRTFTACIERPDLAADPRFATNPDRVRNVDALEAALAPLLATRKVSEWLEIFEAAGVPAGPVLGLDAVLAHPQLAARGMIVDLPHPTVGRVRTPGPPIGLSDTPPRPRRAPPRLGEHTDEILRELGLDAAAIAALRAAGAIGET
ncbi:MAG: CoA transferase [bacterium]